MIELGERNYLLLKQAIKSTGTFDPKEVLPHCLEEIYVDEIDTIRDFLTWVNEDEKSRSFGNGNYEFQFQRFLNSRKDE